MKWIALAAGLVVLLVVLVMVVGSLLPVSHTATVERRVPGRPEDVWSVMTDIEGLPGWRPGLESVERLPDLEGKPVWRETSGHGVMTLEVVGWEPPRRMVTRIADEDLPFGGTWTYRLEPEGDGTRVTITEDGEVYNIFFRFVSRFVMGYEGTMRTYLDGLEARMAGAEAAAGGGT